MEDYNRYYRIVATPWVFDLDYNLLSVPSPEFLRFSMTGEWAIVTYRKLPDVVDFPYYTNDEIIQIIYDNWDEWNPIDSTQEPFLSNPNAIVL